MHHFMRVLLASLFILSVFFPIVAQADDSFWLSLMYQLQNSQMAPMLKYLKELEAIQANSQQALQGVQGNFGYGHLFNTAQDLLARQWSNNTWLDVLALKDGGDMTSAFYQAQQAYAKRYPVMAPEQFNQLSNTTALNKQYYADNSQISRAALAASAYGYDQINKHMKKVSQLLTMLENSPNEKAAIDLNARLVAERSFIALEQLRLQNIQTQVAAIQTQATANGMSDEKSFLEWDTEQQREH